MNIKKTKQLKFIAEYAENLFSVLIYQQLITNTIKNALFASIACNHLMKPSTSNTKITFIVMLISHYSSHRDVANAAMLFK